MPRWASQDSKSNREKKKNITIEFDTWERLKSFGKMGDTFDDVLNRLMDSSAERSEIQRLQHRQQQDKNIENVNVSPGVVSSRVGGTREQIEQQSQQRQLVNDAVTETYDVYSFSFSIPLPEIKYPITKKELIELVKEFKNRFNKKYKKLPLKVEQALFLMENLPGPSSKVYKTETALNLDLDILVNTKEIMEKVVGYPTRMRGCRIRFIADVTDSVMRDLLQDDEMQRINYHHNRQEYLQQKQQDELYNLKDEKWSPKGRSERISTLWNFVGKIADGHKIHGSEAAKLIMKQKDLLKKVCSEMGTDDEAYVYYLLKSDVDEFEAQVQRNKEAEEKRETKEKPKEKEEAAGSAS